jgi:hypothetical protein
MKRRQEGPGTELAGRISAGFFYKKDKGASPLAAGTGLSGAPLRSGPACGVAASPPSNPLRGRCGVAAPG